MQNELLQTIRDFYLKRPAKNTQKYGLDVAKFALDLIEQIEDNPSLLTDPDDMKTASLDIENPGKQIIFNIPRGGNYDYIFESFLERSGFDSYGHIANEKLKDANQNDKYGFENDVFILRPYYWGDDDELYGLPNFVYKPTDVRITWYKYPLRGAMSNTMMSPGDFAEILAECEASLDCIYGGKGRIVERPETKAEIMEYDRKLTEVVDYEKGLSEYLGKSHG